MKNKKNLTADTNPAPSFLCALRGEWRVSRYYELHPGQPHIITIFDIFVYIFSLYILFMYIVYILPIFYAIQGIVVLCMKKAVKYNSVVHI